MWVDMRRLMWKFLTKGKKYGHSHLFVPKNCPDLNWSMLEEFFSRKNIIIATGNIDKIKDLTLGKNTNFIDCGTENAYERKEEIKQAISKEIFDKGYKKSETIILASLGPTAGIIARELLAEDICVWDTGHMFKFAAKEHLEHMANK